MTNRERTFGYEMGYAGWVRIDDDALPGPLYLRIDTSTARPRVSELYLDGGDHEVQQRDLRELPMASYVSAVLETSEHRDEFERRTLYPGPQLGLLASWFASTPNVRGRKDWIAESWRAQIRDSGVVNPKRRPGQRERDELSSGTVDGTEPPLPRYVWGDPLTDSFLDEVARYYRWCVATRRRPAKALSAQTGAPERTVRSWFVAARQRGILAPTTPGKASG